MCGVFVFVEHVESIDDRPDAEVDVVLAVAVRAVRGEFVWVVAGGAAVGGYDAGEGWVEEGDEEDE